MRKTGLPPTRSGALVAPLRPTICRPAHLRNFTTLQNAILEVVRLNRPPVSADPIAQTMNTTLRSGESPEILFHLRWVAKIALLVGAIAGAGLVATLSLVADGTGVDYGTVIHSRSVAQYRLGPALLIGGLFLLAFAAILTWLITLYSSFRIAGPLFRLSRNLEASISQGPGRPVPIRESDRLRPEAALLEAAFAAVAVHYDELREGIDQSLESLEAGHPVPEERQAILTRLKQSLERAFV